MLSMIDLRHSLVDGFDAVSHGKLIHHFLGSLVKVDLPGIIALGRWKLDLTPFLHTQEVEEVLDSRENKNMV